MACCSGHMSYLEKFIANDIYINMMGDNGTPLYNASKYGQLEVVKYLVEKGADVNLRKVNPIGYLGMNCGQQRYRNTPLYMACTNGHLDVVKYLLEHGADANLRDFKNMLPLDMARKCCKQVLRDHGAKSDYE